MDVLQALHDSSLATWLRQPGIVYPLLNAVHILSLSLVVGSIATLDLRLLGLFRTRALGQLGSPLWRMAAIGVMLAGITGFLLFSVRPVAYVQNPAFLLKLALVVLGVANALVLRCLPQWRDAIAGGAIRRGIKLSAALSLAIWVGAVVAGRWIAFVH